MPDRSALRGDRGPESKSRLPFGLLFFYALLLPSVAVAHLEPVKDREPNNTPGTATPLTTKTTCFVALGTISPPGDADYFSFEAPAGARVWALVDTGRSTASRDSVLTLFGTNGTTRIDEDDDGGVGSGCDITVETSSASAIAGRTLPARGTYFFRVRAKDASSTITHYMLFVVMTFREAAEAEPNDLAANATPIVTSDFPIGVRHGWIRSAENDYYAALATAGLVLHVSIVLDPGRSAGTDLGVDLIRSNGTVLTGVQARSGGPRPNLRVSFCLITNDPDTYFIRIRGLPSPQSSAAVGYTLLVAACGVHDTPGLPGETASPWPTPAMPRTPKRGAP